MSKIDDIHEIGGLLERMKLSYAKINRIPDSEWLELHAWAMEYRKTNKLTIRQFCEAFDIPNSSTYQQYLSSNGNVRKVSNKSGSEGKALRDMLIRARTSSGKPIDPPKARENCEQTCDILIEHLSKLQSVGISSYNMVRKEEETAKSDTSMNELWLKLSVDVTKRSLDTPFEDFAEDFRKVLRESEVKGNEVEIKIDGVVWVSPCSYSPYCIDGNSGGVGSASLVSAQSRPVILTAKHTLLRSNSAIKYVKDYSIDGQSVLRDSTRDLFAFTDEGLWNNTLDIAVAVPIEQFRYFHTNFMKGIGCFSFIPSQDMSDFSKRAQDPSSSDWIIVKNGIATGVTTAAITSFDMDGHEAIIVGKEYKPVVFHGDSGSLWIVLKCPRYPQYEGKVFGLASLVELVPVVGGGIGDNRLVVQGRVLPVWTWNTWLFEELEFDE